MVEGRGSTEVWLDGDNRRHVFEWQAGSLFSIPVNAWHRIVNASSSPALLLGGTTAPNLMNLINNVDAIFNCPFEFRDRFSGADDFYKYKDDIEPDPVRGLAMRRTNFIPDIVNCDLPLDNRRSPGFRRVEPFMTGNVFYLWIGQHENGRYSKAHAHTSAAVLICLKGKGYTYTWPERLGVTPWQDGKAERDQARRLRAGRPGVGGAGRRALVPPALRRLEGAAAAHRLVRAAQSRTRARPARRDPHRLHRDGHPGRRLVDPLLDGGPVHPHRIRGDVAPRRRREPDEAGVLRQELQGRIAEGVVSDVVIPAEHLLVREPGSSNPSASVWAGPCTTESPGLLGPRFRGDDKRSGMTDEAEGGRIFFSSTGRTLAEEDEICLLTVGVDIGSSTSHLVFSRVVLERLDSRYVVSERESFYQSDILLTPYAATTRSMPQALGAFIERAYADAKVDPDEIDTGALILTGVAVRRRNARRIGELFARQAGKLVAVSAGDSLEAMLAAYGSGAVARSIRDQARPS